MKNLFILKSCVLTALLTLTLVNSVAENDKTEKSADKKVLIVGMSNNVQSNHFYDTWITEETGIASDDIDKEYNTIIGENITKNVQKNEYDFVYISNEEVNQVLEKVKMVGEGENRYSDLSSIPQQELQHLLDSKGCQYMLVLNQHYLKWQEKPMQTIFHIVNYSLFDNQKKEIMRGNNNFTSMNLEKPDKLRQISRKSSSKIASNVIKSLENK